ncbi:MAG: TIGR00730 family Rossman fold protein [Acetobacteraceae bacterium]|nr:TIGR00730 family Rossman fold protein [Acetobacteraceae bacterium]
MPDESVQHPHSAAADRRAAVRDIMAHSSYLEADHDIGFLASESTRGVRLQLDYLKAEQLLKAHGIAHTIVVFGGTHIREEREAARAVVDAEAALAHHPDDLSRQRALSIARRLHEKSRFYTIARELGRLVGAAGDKAVGGRVVVMTGGGSGIMEAANRGAHDVGQISIGLNISLPHEQRPNPYITPELCLRFHYFAMRKLHFLLRARALVVFPGGYGTLDELFEVLVLVQTHKLARLPVILVGRSFWDRVFDVEFMVEEGVIAPEDRDLFQFAETADDIWRMIVDWHECAGNPLCHQGAD